MIHRRAFIGSLGATGLVGFHPTLLFAQATTIEASEFLKFDGRPEDEGFAALVAALQRAPGPKVVRFPGGQKNFTLANGRQVDLPSNTRWDFGKTTLRFTGAIQGNGVLLRFGPSSEVMGLSMALSASASCDRLLVFQQDCTVDRLDIRTERQLANGGDNSDGLVQVRGSRVKLMACSVAGVDRPVAVIGSGAREGDTAALTDVRIIDLALRDFVCGLLVHNTRGCVVEGLNAKTKSPNAKASPGHNAVLAARAHDFVLRRFHIEEAGEHAVRIGGSTNPHEAPNQNIQILDGTIRDPGKCGVKFWSAGKAEDVADAAVVGAVVRGLSIFDCGSGKISNNEDAVRLEVVKDFVVENITAAAQKSSASCHDVVYLAGCGNGRINNINASRAVRSAVYITEMLGAGRSAPVGSIQATDVQSVDHRGDLVHLAIPTQSAGPFAFKGLSARGGVNLVGGEAPKLVGESTFDGVAERLSGTMNGLAPNSRKARVSGRPK